MNFALSFFGIFWLIKIGCLHCGGGGHLDINRPNVAPFEYFGARIVRLRTSMYGSKNIEHILSYNCENYLISLFPGRWTFIRLNGPYPPLSHPWLCLTTCRIRAKIVTWQRILRIVYIASYPLVFNELLPRCVVRQLRVIVLRNCWVFLLKNKLYY